MVVNLLKEITNLTGNKNTEHNIVLTHGCEYVKSLVYDLKNDVIALNFCFVWSIN